jgi:SAM-dependent methyltransferase
MPNLRPSFLQLLACPQDHTRLRAEEDNLACEHHHRFNVEEGIPILIDNPRREPSPRNMEPCLIEPGASVDPFVNDWLVNTNGNLYRRVRGRLRRYPIPFWPTCNGDGRLLVDVGCGWGRWTIAAARAGFRPVGLDVHIDALAAGIRVSRQMDVRADYVCSDVDRLPFQTASVDFVFSYSVLQHLEKSVVVRFFREVSRVLKPKGVCLVQLPNVFGLHNMLQQAKRGFREGRSGSFEMRYWSTKAIRRAVEMAGLKNMAIRPDGFFTQNPQLSDLDLLSPKGKLIVLASNAGRKLAAMFPIVTGLADSLWVEARVS